MEDGEYEPVNETHSYDALFRASSYSFFNIVFHADHHFYASREYYKLRVYDRSPKLPFSYSSFVLIAMVPQLFFRIMNPVVLQFYARQGIDYDKMLKEE